MSYTNQQEREVRAAISKMDVSDCEYDHHDLFAFGMENAAGLDDLVEVAIATAANHLIPEEDR